MATPSVIPSNSTRETVQRIHRVTRENRSLWYLLTVLQQPERARACGSGMKANSDRRPVDPPPVVELRIYEGPSVEEGKLITFEYNANFFLYASLESARTIAHGRVQSPAASNPPILTGVPASGMAYLDKPAEAGYFIFPDLSVRHEGNYRLSFSLFEMTKEEKDYDLEPAETEMPSGVDWRMEIKTLPFSVYSAKKFPGLMESTPLSRTVAEQGCRVRIRRDVRMRKRDGKSGNMERREEEYSRHRTMTPAPSDEHQNIRPRSVSNSSEQRTPYASESQRRPSAADSYPPPPPTYDAVKAQPRGGHLSFGEQNGSQYTAPPQYERPSVSQLPPVSPSGPYTSYVKVESKPYTYVPSRVLPQPSPSPSQSVKSDPVERRQSIYQPPPSPSVYSSVDSQSRRESYHYTSQPPTPLAPAPAARPIEPAKTVKASMSVESLLMAPRPKSEKLPPINAPPLSPRCLHKKPPTPTRTHAVPLSDSHRLPPIEAQSLPMPPPPVINTGDKRKRDLVFSHDTDSLYNGMRHEDPHFRGRKGAHPVPDDGYYRADGSFVPIPSLAGGWVSRSVY